MPQRVGAQIPMESGGPGMAGIWPSVLGQGGDPHVHERFTDVGDENHSPGPALQQLGSGAPPWPWMWSGPVLGCPDKLPDLQSCVPKAETDTRGEYVASAAGRPQRGKPSGEQAFQGPAGEHCVHKDS